MYNENLFKKLDKINNGKSLIGKAIRDTPLTENCRITGWILKNGKKLDYSDGDILRVINHSRVCGYIDSFEEADEYDNSTKSCLDYFALKTGAIRYALSGSRYDDNVVSNHNFDFHCKVKPTKQQWATIRACLQDYPGDVYYDMYDNDGNHVDVLDGVVRDVYNDKHHIDVDFASDTFLRQSPRAGVPVSTLNGVVALKRLFDKFC